MPGWCNGSAGNVFLWTLAHSFFGNSLYLDLAEKSAMDAFEGSGGGHGLCCGFAGQAYAQLNIYNHTGERAWLQKARILAEKAAAAGNRVREGLPHSLYKGDIGVAVLIAELEKPETAAMPFFESPR
jgi:serine/threonine-protein kinase